jgi:hypothetical protein
MCEHATEKVLVFVASSLQYRQSMCLSCTAQDKGSSTQQAILGAPDSYIHVFK